MMIRRGEPEEAPKTRALLKPREDLANELEPAIVPFDGRLERVHSRVHVGDKA
jgi:hypothetical protein